MQVVTARYFDGQSIQPLGAELIYEANSISIKTDEETINWPAETIIVIERPHDGKPCIIGNREIKGARIIFDNPALYQMIVKDIPKKNILLSHVHHPWRKLSIAVLMIILIIGGAILGIPYFSPAISKMVPHEWDDELGQYVISQMTIGQSECTDESGQKALQQIVKRLTSQQTLEQTFTVIVVDFDDINAFTVPGYHVVIMKGLIDAASTPDDVAGVLAHEMSHAILHHPTSSLITQLGVKVIIASAFGSFPDFGLTLLNFSYSRANEFEADELGIKLLNDANLSAAGLANFFNTIITNYGEIDTFSKYLSTHPPSKERIDRVVLLNQIEKASPVLNEKEFQDLRNICRKKKLIR